MLKITIGLKQVEDTLNINLIDPTAKQLEAASDMEKITAQAIKDVLDKRLLELLEEDNKKEENI